MATKDRVDGLITVKIPQDVKERPVEAVLAEPRPFPVLKRPGVNEGPVAPQATSDPISK